MERPFTVLGLSSSSCEIAVSVAASFRVAEPFYRYVEAPAYRQSAKRSADV
jgi:hypothetical protein